MTVLPPRMAACTRAVERPVAMAPAPEMPMETPPATETATPTATDVAVSLASARAVMVTSPPADMTCDASTPAATAVP